MGSHASGATAVPENLNAANSETAPPRLAGTASTAIVFRAAHSSADTAPAANHSSAIAPTDGAMPSGAIITAQPIAASTAARAAPSRSEPRPPPPPQHEPGGPLTSTH